MKILSMTNRFFLLTTILLTSCMPLLSQDLSSIIFGKHSKSDYIGQYKDNHKQKNGMGIQRLRKGAIYIGDFSDGKMSGKGMLFAGKDELDNIPGAIVYIGHLINGKKERNGVCYSANGDILYKGRFVDDKPIDAYPQAYPDELTYFTMMEWGEDVYWGEVSQGIPHGSALVMNKDGSMWYGNYDHGEKKGICIIIYGEDSWEVGKWEGGTFTSFNNSDIVANRRKEFVAARKELNARLRSEFWNVALDALSLTATIVNSNNDSSYEGSNDTENGSGVGSGTNQSGKIRTNVSSSKVQSSCGSAWMSDSRVYSNYESQLITHGAEMSASERQSISNKMRSIREKWEKRGCPITKSTLE